MNFVKVADHVHDLSCNQHMLSIFLNLILLLVR